MTLLTVEENFREPLVVPSSMGNPKGEDGTPEWLILIGAVAFMLVLAISACWEPDIRLLHFFQAWM